MFMKDQGFTLIEMIMVLATLSIVSLFSFQFFTHASKIYCMMRGQNILYHEAVVAMERMSREIRDATSIIQVAPGKIKIQKANDTPLDTNTRVTFILDNNILKRGSRDTSGDPSNYFDLAENVKTNGFTVTNASNEISLSLELALPGGENISLESKIYPKNLPFDPLAGNYSGRDFNGDWQELIYEPE